MPRREWIHANGPLPPLQRVVEAARPAVSVTLQSRADSTESTSAVGRSKRPSSFETRPVT